MSRLTRDKKIESVSQTKLSDANGDTEMFIFPAVQLITNSMGNLTPFIYTLL